MQAQQPGSCRWWVALAGQEPTVAEVWYPARCLVGLPVEASAGRAPRRCVASPVFAAARSAVHLHGSRACLPARTGSWCRSACWRAGEESQVAPEGASAGSRRVADASQPGSTIQSCAPDRQCIQVGPMEQLRAAFRRSSSSACAHTSSRRRRPAMTESTRGGCCRMRPCPR